MYKEISASGRLISTASHFYVYLFHMFVRRERRYGKRDDERWRKKKLVESLCKEREFVLYSMLFVPYSVFALRL